LSTIDLDPWGGETNRSANSAFQPHKYTSYERDGNGGDDAMMRRYQSNWTRFSQPDPYDGSYDANNPQSFNRYSYVQNDSVNFVDPSGLFLATESPHGDPFDPSKCYTLYIDGFQVGTIGNCGGGGGGGGERGGGGGTGGPGTTQNPAPQSQALPDCVKKLLAKYFDQKLLDSIHVHTDGIPWYVPTDMVAYTSNDDVYFAQDEYDPHSVGGIALIGHETTHGRQYRQSGNFRFKTKYLAQSAVKGAAGLIIPGGSTGLASDLSYYGNKFEQEAYTMEKKILTELDKEFHGNNPCP
jgi:RHS repeat-associated protein